MEADPVVALRDVSKALKTLCANGHSDERTQALLSRSPGLAEEAQALFIKVRGLVWEEDAKAASERLKATFGTMKAKSLEIGKGGMFKCCCCRQPLSPAKAARIEAFIPKDHDVRRRLEELENIASYIVCDECDRLPEDEMMSRIQEYLIEGGLFRSNLKRLDAPGGHSPGHQKQHHHGDKDSRDH